MYFISRTKIKNKKIPSFSPFSIVIGKDRLWSPNPFFYYSSCYFLMPIYMHDILTGEASIWLNYCVVSIAKQFAAYITFAANSAATVAAVLAITGAEEFQWMKLCNRFTRFCFQMGGALLCGYVASILMALISFISAYNLFRNYSPNRFLHLKKT